MCRLAEIMIPQFNQPAVRAIRVLRPLKLVTGFESKYPFTTSAEASHLSVVSTPITWIPARVEPNAIYTYTYPNYLYTESHNIVYMYMYVQFNVLFV